MAQTREPLKKTKMKKKVLLATLGFALFIVSCQDKNEKKDYDYCDCVHMLKVKDIDPNLKRSCEELVQANNELEQLSPGSTDPNECK